MGKSGSKSRVKKRYEKLEDNPLTGWEKDEEGVLSDLGYDFIDVVTGKNIKYECTFDAISTDVSTIDMGNDTNIDEFRNLNEAKLAKESLFEQLNDSLRFLKKNPRKSGYISTNETVVSCSNIFELSEKKRKHNPKSITPRLCCWTKPMKVRAEESILMDWDNFSFSCETGFSALGGLQSYGSI